MLLRRTGMEAFKIGALVRCTVTGPVYAFETAAAGQPPPVSVGEGEA